MTRLALALLLATPAHAAPLHPPERFSGPYAGELIVERVQRANVWRECSDGGRHDIRRDAAGCAILGDGFCVVFIAERTRRAPVGDILRHEIAHCNGWAADHEMKGL